VPKIAHGVPRATTPPLASTSLTTPGSGGRDRAIDLLRGFCIVSMTTAHLAAGSWPWRVFHIGTFIDGAVGFVFLSGLVLGITQRKAIVRGGLLAGQRKLLRRTAMIYVANFALCLLAFATVAVDPERESTYPSVDTLGGPLPAALASLSLRFSPHFTSILSLYVVLLLLALVAVVGLRFRRPSLVITGSVLLYVAGYLWPALFTFSVQPGVPGPVNWATWQLLFMVALVVGWHWQSARIRWALTSRGLFWLAASLVLGLSVLGWRITHGARPDWATAVFRAFTEGTLAPGTIVMAFAAVLVGYRVCRRLVRVAWPGVSPIARIGRRSLDCYLILSTAVIVLPSVYAYPPAGIVAVGVAFDVLALMFLWCLLRDRRGRAGRAVGPAEEPVA
jgi:hypothetical protein